MKDNLNKTIEKCTKHSILIYTAIRELKYGIVKETIKLHKNKIINYFTNKEFTGIKIEYIKLSTSSKYTKCMVLLWSKNMSIIIPSYVNKTVAMLMNKLCRYVQNTNCTHSLEIETEWRTL